MERELGVLFASLDLLKYIGLHPKYGKVRILIGLLTNSVRIYFFFCCIQMLRNSNGKIDEIIDAVGTLTTFTQAIAKLIPLLFYTKDMLKLIEQTKSLRKQSADLIEVENIYKNGIKAIKIYKSLVLIATMLFFIFPIFTKNLIFPMWIPEYEHSYWFMLIIQYVILIFDAICVYSIDSFYVSVCINIIAQFYLLNTTFIKLDDYKDDGSLKAKVESCIRHHAFLLEHMNVLKKCYSVSLMLVYLISIYSCCTQLYGGIERNTLAAIIGAVVYLGTITCQMAIYCFPADATTQIALDTSVCMNMNQWYTHPLKVQKYMPLMIMRSQQPLRFTAGGLADIDKTAFVKIFKTGFSFYTLIKNVKDKI